MADDTFDPDEFYGDECDCPNCVGKDKNSSTDDDLFDDDDIGFDDLFDDDDE